MGHDPVIQGFSEDITGNIDLCWKEEIQKLNEHIEAKKKRQQHVDETNAITLASA